MDLPTGPRKQQLPSQQSFTGSSTCLQQQLDHFVFVSRYHNQMSPANASRWRVQPVIQPVATSLNSPKNELQSAHETTSVCKIRLRQSSGNKQPQYPTYKNARSKFSRVGERTVAGLRVMLMEAILPVSLISGRVISQELPTGLFTASACKCCSNYWATSCPESSQLVSSSVGRTLRREVSSDFRLPEPTVNLWTWLLAAGHESE